MELNIKQQEAVIADNSRVLVLAGAGSGKTKTLIQKILYLITEKNAKASSILAITFTKNAANEMLDRVIIATDSENKYEKILSNKKLTFAEKNQHRDAFKKQSKLAENLTIRTIHSLCYSILKTYGVKVFDNQFKLLVEETTKNEAPSSGQGIAPETPKNILHNVLIELCKEPSYLLTFKRYIIDHYIDQIQIKNTKSNNYEEDIKYTTLKGDKVRSKSERDIADWLYRHNISYKYEKVVAVKSFATKPDFFIEQANIYIEHVSNLSSNVEEKLAEYKKGGLVCEVIYESEMHDSALMNHILENIIYKHLNEQFITQPVLNYQEEFKFYMDQVDAFIYDVLRVISMIKSNDSDLSNIEKTASSNKHERVQTFYKLAIPITKKYKEYCTYKSYLDFDDLITKVIELLREHSEIRERYKNLYKYILVDEFQDVNHLQVQLLKLLLGENSQLFCVGDDWQSIYGFRGSEVDYIVNFEKHFPSSKIIKLDVNYRSTQNIVGASNEVIKKNKFQVPKEVKAFHQSLKKIQVFRAKDIEKDGVDFMLNKIKHYFAKGYSQDDILVLYRRNKMFFNYSQAIRNNQLRISAKTIHAAKGLEAKIVFIIGLKDGPGGFPDVWLDDMIFRIVKDTPIDSLMEEERRLFYVAMTRAKEELYLITQSGNESSFIDEIPAEFSNFSSVIYAKENHSENETIECPKCHTLKLIKFKFCPECGEPSNIN
jgi:Superfamily I DNA and RNA helicases